MLCETDTTSKTKYIRTKGKKAQRNVRSELFFFVVAVMARLVGDYVSKWLDRHFKSDK